MNTKTLANYYSQLSAEERFRLVVAAHGRGDEAERERLINASKRVTFSDVDYAPYGHALQELALLVLLTLVEEATTFDDAFECWRDADTTGLIDCIRKVTPPTAERIQAIKDRFHDDHLFHLCLAQGFKLRTTAAGWKLFCDRLGISPFAFWHKQPGFDRLQRALKTAEGAHDRPAAAFTPNVMAHWMNSIRPDDDPELTEADLISAESYADSFDAVFRNIVRRWAG